MSEKNNEIKNKICKFYVKGECRDKNNCKFIHEKDICKNYFFEEKCDRINCKFKHQYSINNNIISNNTNISNNNSNNINNINNNSNNINNFLKKNKNERKHVKNTENFNPDYRPADMNILVNKSQTTYKDNDVIVVPNFIEEINKYDIFDKLIKEMDNTEIHNDKLWKEWHGGNHLIADDHLNWKEKVKLFNDIINKIEKYFNMEVKSTRFNLYEDSSDWKPYHHDAAAVKEHIAENQNFTVGISFGATRDIAFEHAKNKTRIYIPLENCTAYAFSKNINVDWKHGVPKIPPEKKFSKARISIIAWGKVNIEN
jgi:hypothetical protein